MMRGTVVGLASPRPMGPAMPGPLPGGLRSPSGSSTRLDTVLAPVIGTLDNLDAYFDPYLAPEDFLAWLAAGSG